MPKVFVGNFSFTVDDAQLKDYFSKVGSVVSAKVMKDAVTGRSRGFGFVDFSLDEEAEKAIKELDGSLWDGRPVKVSQDRSVKREGESAGHQQYSSSSSYSGGGGDYTGSSENGYQRYGSSSGPVGFFRAQPLDIGVKKKKKIDPFIEDPSLKIDYKEPKLLARFMSERGRVLPRRMTGLTSMNQRMVTRAIRRAKYLALLPYSKR